MKPIGLTLVFALSFFSCKKDTAPIHKGYAAVVKEALRDSLGADDFAALDFQRAVCLRVDSVSLFCYRIPFRSGNPRENFVLVKTDAAGKIDKGNIVHLQGKVSTEGTGDGKRQRWDGFVSLTSLDKKSVFTSPVVDGYFTALHQQENNRLLSKEPEGDVMPEVVITYVKTADQSSTWSPWYCLESFYANGESGGGGYYSDFSGGSYAGSVGDSGGGGSITSSGGSDPVILIDKETQDNNPAIDVQTYIRCFGNIPDAGATCNIEVYTDIPVDANPDAFFDLSTLSPGHTFISLSKANGSQHVTQYIGFYPRSGYKSMTYAPTAGKLVDNAHHEFNASLFMPLTPVQLSIVLLRLQQLSNLNYDIDQYNCTDWALDIFNSVRTNKLEIPLYGIPDSPMTQSSRTPQGLYNKLLQMMNNNDPERGNITIGIVKGYAGGSTGPCN